MNFVDEWRHAWKWLSVQLGALIAIAPTLYEQADILQDYVEPKWFHLGMTLLGVLVVFNSIKKKRR